MPVRKYGAAYQGSKSKIADEIISLLPNKKYQKSDKYKKYHKKYNKEYANQLCRYNGEVLTLNALRIRFKRAGVEHPTLEAKQYLQNIEYGL